MAKTLKETAETALKPASDAAKRVGDAAREAAKPVTDAANRVQEAVTPVMATAKKVGGDFSYRFHRAWSFLDGTIKGVLNYTSRFGRRGLYIGAIAGAVAMLVPGGVFAFAALELPIAGALLGAAVGSVLGATTGLVRGGLERLEIEDRKERYETELGELRDSRRSQTTRRKGGPNTVFARASDQIGRENFDRYKQYHEMINERDRAEGERNYSFVERLDASREHASQQGNPR